LQGETEKFHDGMSIGGWPMDDHPPSGFDRWDVKPTTQIKLAEPYNFPLRSLYSRNISNLMMAGRNISASHVAFTSARVMATCSGIGQGVGTAAMYCVKHGLTPRQVAQDKTHMHTLQQILLRDDQAIYQVKNADAKDLARKADVTASHEMDGAECEHVINGFVRDVPTKTENVWIGKMAKDGAWLELTWKEPQKISQVQITFDTGFQRPLTLTSQNSYNAKMVRGPQPECVRDYELLYTGADGKRRSLAKVEGNHQRLNRHNCAAVEAKSIRLQINATNGAETAHVYEVRCYA
jgi:hypothetical protein